MRTRELRQLTNEDLQQELSNHRKELYNLRHRGVVEQLENPAQVGKTRRAIAQILTLLREREIQTAREPQAPAQKVEAKS